jgi:ParB-like chromosome segregation protein Spo0J
VEPVALHIHESIAAQVIVKVAARQDVQRDLFADPQLSYREAVQFYRHDIDWANRLILGDSLHEQAQHREKGELVQMLDKQEYERYLEPANCSPNCSRTKRVFDRRFVSTRYY